MSNKIGYAKKKVLGCTENVLGINLAPSVIPSCIINQGIIIGESTTLNCFDSIAPEGRTNGNLRTLLQNVSLRLTDLGCLAFTDDDENSAINEHYFPKTNPDITANLIKKISDLIKKTIGWEGEPFFVDYKTSLLVATTLLSNSGQTIKILQN